MGDRLGAYELVGPIGKGGMGEVFRARDTKLGRDVAIKMLPADVSGVPERLARFRREAQVLASLNHPNIASIHGLEEHDGQPFLVLELVEGEDLSARVKRGPIPLDEALDIARQVAEALEEAHDKGIVHRDLKPANIMITPDGKVKVLDFGLAKAYAVESEAPELSQSPTISRQATAAGVILGTAAYMSPEQAKGRPVDKRTDIWAFGVVLYEMLTGRQAFAGDDFSETLAAILKEEPDWTKLPASTPAKLIELSKRCLRKDAKRRWHDIADARIELEEMDEGAAAVVAERRAQSLASMLVLAVLASIVTGVAVWTVARSDTTPRPVTRTVLPLPEGSGLGCCFERMVALSPDGRLVAYVAREAPLVGDIGLGDFSDGPSGVAVNQALYVRALDALEARRIPDTEPASSPVFSPDGRWIAFTTGRGLDLARVSVTGGAPVSISTDRVSRGLEWLPDDTLVYTRMGMGLSRVPSEGGDTETLTTPDLANREKTHRLPHALPDGTAVLFTDGSADIASFDEASIVLLDLESGERKVLIEGGSSAQYVTSGHIVYARAGTLVVVPFDADAREVTGPPVTVVEDVKMDPIAGDAQFSISRGGDLLYVTGGAFNPGYAIVLVDRRGTIERVTKTVGRYESASLSPDETRLAIFVGGANNRVGIYDRSRDTMTRYITGFENIAPRWMPTGDRFVFSSNRAGEYNLYWNDAAGATPEERLTTSEFLQLPGSGSRDGEWYTFEETRPDTGWDIWLLPLQGERTPRPLLQTPADEQSPRISPDGRFLVYRSNESGQDEVYLRAFPEGDRTWRVSTSGGSGPLWNPNGREILYRNSDEMLAVDIDVDARGEPIVGSPRTLFTIPRGLGAATSITADGERLLFSDRRERETSADHLVLVQNWAEELKRLVPTD